MYRLIFSILIFALTATAIQATECQFVFGFKAYRDSVGHAVIGECLENEWFHTHGTQQRTTNGTLYWNRDTNTVTFVEGQPAPSPTPVPRPPDPPVIDEEFESVLQVLRGTGPIGEYWYNQVYALGVDVRFAPIEICGETACNVGGGAIWVAWGFYAKYQDNPRFLASVIVHELAHVVWDNEGRPDTTTEDCFANEANSEKHRARWLIEYYGDRVDRIGHWGVIKAYRAGTMLERVKSSSGWQRHCEKYYESVPTPTPAPTAAPSPTLAPEACLLSTEHAYLVAVVKFSKAIQPYREAMWKATDSAENTHTWVKNLSWPTARQRLRLRTAMNTAIRSFSDLANAMATEYLNVPSPPTERTVKIDEYIREGYRIAFAAGLALVDRSTASFFIEAGKYRGDISGVQFAHYRYHNGIAELPSC